MPLEVMAANSMGYKFNCNRIGVASLLGSDWGSQPQKSGEIIVKRKTMCARLVNVQWLIIAKKWSFVGRASTTKRVLIKWRNN